MSFARAEALIVEDSPHELDQLVEATRQCGFEPVPTRSPAQAMRLLRVRRPALAIIDWDMRHAPGDDVVTSEPVLQRLARAHPNATTIVFAGGTTNLNLHALLVRAHPGALVHDKALGLATLLTRIEQLLERRVGDLAIAGGGVVHRPSGLRHHHTIALSLVLNHPKPVHARRQSADAAALHRFQRWLRARRSTVECVARGGGVFELVAVEPSVDAPDQD